MNDAHAAAEDLRKELEVLEGPRRWVRRALLAAALAGFLAASLVWRAVHAPPAPSRYLTASVDVGDILVKVQATGTVQPMLQVNIGAEVNGRITQVLVDVNSVVKKGDVLAEIDSTIYGAQASEAGADLAAQRAQASSAKAAYEMS